MRHPRHVLSHHPLSVTCVPFSGGLLLPSKSRAVILHVPDFRAGNGLTDISAQVFKSADKTTDEAYEGRVVPPGAETGFEDRTDIVRKVLLNLCTVTLC